MPRRTIFSATERANFLVQPESQENLIHFYTFNGSDMALIRQRRGDANRIGFAVQHALLLFPGFALGSEMQ